LKMDDALVQTGKGTDDINSCGKQGGGNWTPKGRKRKTYTVPTVEKPKVNANTDSTESKRVTTGGRLRQKVCRRDKARDLN